MKGKELIEIIKRGMYEDFDIEFSFTDGYTIFPNVRTFKIANVSDIAHSDKKLIFEGEEE